MINVDCQLRKIFDIKNIGRGVQDECKLSNSCWLILLSLTNGKQKFNMTEGHLSNA